MLGVMGGAAVSWKVRCAGVSIAPCRPPSHAAPRPAARRPEPAHGRLADHPAPAAQRPDRLWRNAAGPRAKLSLRKWTKENDMPLMRTAMYAKGIEIWCAPTADARDSWIASMRHIAVEGRCFVLSCNQFTRRSDFPADFPCNTRGGSCIVDPFGEILAGPHFDGETILVAEIDGGQIARGKFDLDAVGHHARPDVFRLIVDERRKAPVTVITDSVPEVEYRRDDPGAP